MPDPSYGRTAHVAADFATAVAAVREELSAQGFGVLTEIDVQGTLKAKLGHDMEDYVILGACSPPLARRALEADRSVGLLLPCNVVVRVDGDGVLVQAVEPNMLVTLTGDGALAAVAEEAAGRLDAVLAAVQDRFA
ncbi:DUF302 domain-containing protein [Streptomyces sp. NPDC006372]|uniref:DUF302 domain-containing protein n=1 Tax=Streptomyces sp. NPDC006372 TaxID=3155599 RepID=UPI0033AD9EE4